MKSTKEHTDHWHRSDTGKLYNEIFYQVEYFMHNWCGDPDISIHKFCINNHFSIRTVQRAMSFSGTSWREQLRHIRIRKACLMLRISDMKIKEIAYITGYRSGSQLSRAFKDCMGISPDEYRKQNH